MNYTEITSAYIKSQLAKSPWQDHKRIDSLVSLHRYILNPPRNWSGGMAFTHLKSQYRIEYLELLFEHSPVAFEEVLAHERAFIERSLMRQAEEDAKAEELKRIWLLAGGRP